MFSNLAEQISVALQLAEASATWRTHAEVMLRQSAAVDNTSTIQYRPYLVAAMLLEQQPSQQKISSADGAAFTNMVTPIQSLYRLQWRIDRANPDWVIPPGFIAPTMPVEGSLDDPDNAGTIPYFVTQAIAVERRA
jgi:hypothetical protein